VPLLPDGQKYINLRSLVLIQYRGVTDRATHSYYALCIAMLCRLAYKPTREPTKKHNYEL